LITLMVLCDRQQIVSSTSLYVSAIANTANLVILGCIIKPGFVSVRECKA
jgi:predicted cupin superfamily sugar epimerase